MAKLPIIEFPDPRLRTIAKPVAKVDGTIRKLIDDMFETMYDAPGIGLAATQVDVHQRLLVLDVSEDKSNPMVFINPEIIDTTGTQIWNEGCLSFPGVSEEIKRADSVRVRALDAAGKPFEMEADGLMAVAIQHENDHLDGVLILDRMTQMSRLKNRAAIKDLEASM